MSAPTEGYKRLTMACLEILPDMPTGFEPAGQSMDTTMRQWRIREWRKAVTAAARELVIDGMPKDDPPHSQESAS